MCRFMHSRLIDIKSYEGFTFHVSQSHETVLTSLDEDRASFNSSLVRISLASILSEEKTYAPRH